MKKGSIAAPVILILIGALFLANNLRPEIPLMEFLGRYWPFLLIGWGIVRLLEIVYWAARGRQLPSAGISGGEWVLVIFISLIGSTMYAFHSNGWGPARFRVHGVEMFGESYDYPVDEKKVGIASAKRVVIENFRGNTRITGADDPEVRVSGRKTVRALNQEDANKIDDGTQLEVLDQGDTVLVRTNLNKSPQERYVHADIEIAVPRGITVQARGRHGDFEIKNIKGNVEVDSENAGVRMDDIGGSAKVNVRRSDTVRAVGIAGDFDLQGRGNDVELENVQGQVSIDGSWGGELVFRNLAKPLRFQGRQADVHVQRIEGEVRVGRGFVTGETLGGPVVVRGHGKGCCDVRLNGFSSSLEVDVDGGDVELRPSNPMPKINVELDNGSVELAIPSGARFNLRAQVQKGEVNNDFGDALKSSDEGRGAILAGSVGEGAAITLLSRRGNISVRKSETEPSSAPLTPQPPRPPKKPGRDTEE
jgi:hypothetical protein